MKQKILQLIATSAVLFLVLFIPAFAQEQTPIVVPQTSAPTGGTIADNICKGVLSAETGQFTRGTTIDACFEDADNGFGFLVRRIINIFSVVVGAVSVIMIIIGGFRYIISGGDSAGVSSAKNTILYAVVGLVIVLFAQVIIRFILTNATQITS